MKRTLTYGLLALALLAQFISTSRTIRAQAPARKDPAVQAEEAKAQTLAAARGSYEANKAGNALAGPAVSYSVATKRLGKSRVAVAFSIHVRDSELLSGDLDLKLNYQPVELDGTQVVRNVGVPTVGTFRIARSAGNNDNDAPRHEFAYVMAAPEPANAVSVEMRLIAGGKDYGLTFIKGMTGEATAGTAERAAEGGIAVNDGPARSGAKGKATSAHARSPQSQCCSVAITIGCGTCSQSATCNVCTQGPTVICSCNQQGQCSCGIVCNSGTGCH